MEEENKEEKKNRGDCLESYRYESYMLLLFLLCFSLPLLFADSCWLGYFSLFVLVLGHSESKLHSIYPVGFLTL